MIDDLYSETWFLIAAMVFSLALVFIAGWMGAFP